ncbi:hypothetical protein [Streptomyces hundungensis]|uniref:hypothetical protein n=1 Tax=Streptomyces hundungensis TaxID=1077946 RepID=UPI0013C46BD2|nr:hypothetical protein [Streptomyces hundungensis]
MPVSEWEGHDPLPLTLEEFEEVWKAARRQREAAATGVSPGPSSSICRITQPVASTSK